MEPTTESVTGSGPGTETVHELAPTASRRHPARTAVASLSAIILLAAGIGVVAATRNNGSRPPLVLTPGGRSPEKDAAAGADYPFGFSPYRYRLAITPPDLGSDAPVARLETPAVDDAKVGTMAAALGLHGDVTHSPSGGWQVSDGSAQLTVEPTPGGWAVFYSLDAGDTSPGSVPGAGGTETSGSGSSGSTGSGTAVDPPIPNSTTQEPPITATPPPTSAPVQPENLPGTAEAERIARALLGRLGVADDSWPATVEDSSSTSGIVTSGVACTPEPCAIPEVPVTSRTVVVHPVFNTAVIDGISWRVEIGDNAKIRSVSGTWATLRTIDRYPLRSVAAVFADLVEGKGTSPGPVPLGAASEPAIEPDGGAPDHVIEPVTVTIDHVTLGFVVMPASDDGVAVVDVVPTYVFTGNASGGGEITQELVAVEATVTTPDTAPDTRPGAPPTSPRDTTPPLGKPEPQPVPAPDSPATEPADSGTPST